MWDPVPGLGIIISLGALIDSLLFQGDFIWIEPVVKGQYGAPIGARVISSEAGKILIVDDQGNVGLSLEY